MNMTKTLGCVLMLLILGTGITCAQQSPPENNRDAPRHDRKGPPPSFDQLLKDLDENKDGKLAMTEVKGPLQRDFKRIDKNEDGFITAEEFKKAGPPKRKRPKN